MEGRALSVPSRLCHTSRLGFCYMELVLPRDICHLVQGLQRTRLAMESLPNAEKYVLKNRSSALDAWATQSWANHCCPLCLSLLVRKEFNAVLTMWQQVSLSL